jgi:hypothetical protein
MDQFHFVSVLTGAIDGQSDSSTPFGKSAGGAFQQWFNSKTKGQL